ncbi:ABC transporter ATP-binding protein, partial [Candidatus Gracilibacteria bacterium]|nr:ABC transporter ATP-binding protein [Candidatus Gracilibacteria bacterium]
MSAACAIALQLDNVSFAFDTQLVVQDISLQVRQGELVVLVGPSGCGKSTLLRLVAGLLMPTSGQIVINSVVCDTLLPEQRLVGWVPQSYALFEHLTVAENIASAPALRGVAVAEQRRRVSELLALCEVEELAGAGRCGALS